MSVSDLMLRLRRYETKRSLRWVLIVGGLWIFIWLGSILTFSVPSEERYLDVELLAEESHFYPIDL
ncbi:MAG: hypothetical protein N3E49_02270 [Bacteroidia bacterium]|nr:hypothetical protein [Bacteroidia bacterium]